MCTYIASCTHFSSKKLDFETLLAPLFAQFSHLFGIIFAIHFQHRFLNDFWTIFLELGPRLAAEIDEKWTLKSKTSKNEKPSKTLRGQAKSRFRFLEIDEKMLKHVLLINTLLLHCGLQLKVVGKKAKM